MLLTFSSNEEPLSFTGGRRRVTDMFAQKHCGQLSIPLLYGLKDCDMLLGLFNDTALGGVALILIHFTLFFDDIFKALGVITHG